MIDKRIRKKHALAQELQPQTVKKGKTPVLTAETEKTPQTSAGLIYAEPDGRSAGHGMDAIADRLMELSSKAEENGERYARLTAENAVAAAGRQRGRQRA